MYDRIEMKNLFAFCNLLLEIEINCAKENYVNFKYACSFQRKMLPNLTCVDILIDKICS